MSFGFGVGDFLAAANLAWTLYHDCILVARGAPQEFRMLVEELKTLHMMMKSLDIEFKDPDSVLVRAGEDRHRMIGEMLRRIIEILHTLTDAFNKHRNLGSTARSKFKRGWDKFKWALDAKDIDGLRSKLTYHNGVLHLLLTCAGNSSLQRIEKNTKALDDGLQEVKEFLQIAQSATLSPVKAPLLSATCAINKSTKIAFSERCMRAAEISQRWIAIGIEDWIKAGKWWLLMARMQLQRASVGESISAKGYLDLLKASWILTDVIAVHPQFAYIESGDQFEVMRLTESISIEFKHLQTFDAKLPENLDVDNLIIWEGQSQSVHSPTPKVQKSWTTPNETIVYQAFGTLKPYIYAAQMNVLVTILMDDSKQARIVIHDQSWRCLSEIMLREKDQLFGGYGQQNSDIQVHGNAVTIRKNVVVLPTQSDAKVLYATIYLYCKYPLMASQEPFASNSKYLNIFILIVAVTLTPPYMTRGLLEEGILEMEQFQLSEENIEFPGYEFLQSVHLMMKEIVRTTIPYRARCEVCSIALMGTENSSLLGWLLCHGHHEVAKIWAKESGLHPPNDNTDFERWVDPNTAIQQGRCDVMSWWLSSGLEYEHRGPDWLALAIDYGQLSMLSWLIEHGIEIGKIYREGAMGPLQQAAQLGNEEIVRLLLERGPEYILESVGRDKECKTALHYAAESSNEVILKLLLDRGADVTRQCRLKRTALHYAAKIRDQRGAATAKLLLDRGADIEGRCQNQKTALHYAGEEGHEMIIRLLVSRGADILSVCDRGLTPLYYAAKRGLLDEVKLLLKRCHSLGIESHDYKALLGNFPGDEAPIVFLTAVKELGNRTQTS